MLSPRTLLRRIPTRAMAASGGLMIGAGIFQSALFGTTVLVARSLGRAELGAYAVALAIGSVVVGGVGSGLPIFTLREVAAGRVDRRFVTRVLRTELLATGAATVGASVIGLLVLGGWHGVALGAVAGTSNVLLSMAAVLNSVHSGLLRFRTVVLGNVVGAGALLVATLAVLNAGLGTVGAVAALALAAATTVGWLLWSLRGLFVGEPTVDTSRLFVRSLPLTGVGVINGGYQRIDALIVLAVSNAATAGIYTSAYRILGPFTLMASGFGTVFFTRMSAADPASEEWNRLRRKGAALLSATVLPLALVVSLLMPALIRLLYGAEFGPAVAPARILLLSLVPNVLYLPLAHALNARFHEGRLFTVIAFSIAVQLPVMAGLASRWGAAGAAWAWVVTETAVLVGVCLSHRVGRRRMPV